MSSIDASLDSRVAVGAVIRNDSQQQTYGDRLDCVPDPAPFNLLLSALLGIARLPFGGVRAF